MNIYVLIFYLITVERYKPVCTIHRYSQFYNLIYILYLDFVYSPKYSLYFLVNIFLVTKEVVRDFSDFDGINN